MIQLGYHLSSEELNSRQLVECARMAEEAGFTFATISDHFHPWTTRQGQSPFVWATIGAISQATTTLRLGTAVTCPLIRLHPAIVAQAAATAQELMEGRFFLGLGTGEKLNEHVTGQPWPDPDLRWEMLQEAIQIIRLLWQPGEHSLDGRFYHVKDAQIFSLPDKSPEIFVAANAKRSAAIAGALADGLIAVAPKQDVLTTFSENGGKDKPRIGNLTVSYATSEEQARRVAFETWPTNGLESEQHWNLPTPKAFEEAVREAKVTESQVAQKIICSSKVDDHVRAIEKYIDAGFTHVGIKQCGPDQKRFMAFYRDQVMPALMTKKLLMAR